MGWMRWGSTAEHGYLTKIAAVKGEEKLIFHLKKGDKAGKISDKKMCDRYLHLDTNFKERDAKKLLAFINDNKVPVEGELKDVEDMLNAVRDSQRLRRRMASKTMERL